MTDLQEYQTLSDLYELQAQFDDVVLKQTNLSRDCKLLNKTLIALSVEFNEMLNEWKGFKFWSKRPNVTWETGATEAEQRLLEEAADVLSFTLSLALTVEELEGYLVPLSFENLDDRYDDANMDVLIIDFYRAIVEMVENENGDFISRRLSDLRWIFQIMMHIWRHLGLTEAMLIEAYIKKNQVNHKRQEDGY